MPGGWHPSPGARAQPTKGIQWGEEGCAVILCGTRLGGVHGPFPVSFMGKSLGWGWELSVALAKALHVWVLLLKMLAFLRLKSALASQEPLRHPRTSQSQTGLVS